MRPPESFVGSSVRSLQTMLRTIRQAQGAVSNVIPDGIYGPQTMTAVSAFQRENGMRVTGVTDRQTWDAVVHAFREARTQLLPAEVLRVEMAPCCKFCHGQSWAFLPVAQAMLNTLSKVYPELPSPSMSGTMDDATVRALERFQHYCDLPQTGELDKKTWFCLCRHFTPAAAALDRKMR